MFGNRNSSSLFMAFMTGVLIYSCYSLVGDDWKQATRESDDSNIPKLTKPALTTAQLALLSAGQRIVVMRGDVEVISKKVQQINGKVLTRTASIVTAMVDSSQLKSLLNESSVEEIAVGHQLHGARSYLQDIETDVPKVGMSRLPLGKRSTGIPSEGLKAVHMGMSPLAHAFSGRGVILAVIESALPDFRHPDFRNSDGSTRFHCIWDMYGSGTGPEGYEYGKYFSQTELDELLVNESRRLAFGDSSTHCTNSIGVAAGNGNGHVECMGVAPEATLMYVAVGHENENIIDAVAYIFREAKKLNLPCVVSISLSLTHLQGLVEDGNDMVSLALSEMVESQPGRLIFCSAGNQDGIKLHFQLQPNSACNKELWLRVSGKHGHFSILLHKESVDTIEYQTLIMAVDGQKVRQMAMSEWFSASSLLESGVSRIELEFLNGGDVCGVEIAQVPLQRADLSVSVKLMIERIGKAFADQQMIVAVRCRGLGTLEAWCPLDVSPVSRSTWPEIALPAGLVEADNLRSITSPANGRSVIAVGACRSDDTKEEYSQSGGYFGGQWKPLVLAPVPAPAAVPLDTRIDRSSLLHDGLYQEYAGTSCAAPVLAGVGALYLQKHPQATLQEFVSAIEQSVRQPIASGPFPNPHYGHGIVDIFELLKN